VRLEDGSLAAVMTFHGDDADSDKNSLLWHDLRSEETEVISDDLENTWVKPLGLAGEDHRLIVKVNSIINVVDTDPESKERDRLENDFALSSGSEAVEPSLTGPEQAVRLGDDLYIADIVDDGKDTGRILRVNPDRESTPVEVLAEDWGSDTAVFGVAATGKDDGYFAWKYRDDRTETDTGVIRHLALDGSTSSNVLEDNLNLDSGAPVVSPTPPEGETPLMFYNRGTRDVAGAVDITGAGGGYELERAAWVGQTWSRTEPLSGSRAEYLFYQEDDNNGESVLKSREAGDTTGASAIVFDNAPDRLLVNRNTESVDVHGYGPVTLLGIRKIGTANGRIWFADAADPGSMTEIDSDDARTARPVSFY